ncbi:MAG TPA: hypothetical protein VHG51_07040 [Longimicrobiaceae bacterium]|nr:hypothetical protein [Longimicrobiaceae bacterium]
MKKTLLALALLGLAPAGGAAQDPAGAPNGLRKGAYSLSFGLPSGGPLAGHAGLGFWKMVSDRTNLGVTLDLRRTRTEAENPGGQQEGRDFGAGVGVQAKRYLDATRAVAPFLGGRVGGGYRFTEQSTGGSAVGSEGWRAGAGAGVGLEWFPVRSVSLAGGTGLDVVYYRSRNLAGEADSSTLSVGTFSTDLSLQIWF